MPAFSGALLRAQRESTNLSREAVAVAVGRTASALHKYESGANIPSGRVLGDLAAVLGCGVEAFFGPGAEDKKLARMAAKLNPKGRS
jgi:transcriptional regulator with XRE-family HTH domain